MTATGTAQQAGPFIDLSGVTKTFDGGRIRAIDNVSVAIERGDIFGFIGYSGAGKSTLVRLINALEVPDSGTVRVDGRVVSAAKEAELRDIRRDIGMIFQHFNLFSARTVAANVAYPLKLAKWPAKKRAARVAELLAFVGIADKAKAYPSQLSGGQKQRVGIARALATSPKVLLADEATSALDPETTREVLELLRKANHELGLTVVLITHSMNVVQHLCTRVAVMEAGAIVESGDAHALLSNPQHPATRRFVQSALHDRPSEAVIESIRRRHPGRLAVVSLAGQSDAGIDLSGLDAPATVVFGGVGEVTDRPFGSITLALGLDESAAARAIDQLRRRYDVTDLGTAHDPIADPTWTAAGGQEDPR